MPTRNKSVRAQEWMDFASDVFDHIETYAIPQYGDKGQDQCSEFTPKDFITQMKKYLNRFGRNSRPGQDLLDCKKIAHYAQMLHDRLSDSEDK